MSDVRTIITTENGKQVILFHDRKTNLYRLKFKPGGQLPQEFEGAFTSPRMAENVVNGYYARKNKPKKVGRPATVNG